MERTTPPERPAWFDETYFDDTENEKGGPRWNPRSYHKTLLRGILSLPEPIQLLDVGCGRGHIVKALNVHGYTARGIDVSQWAIDNTAADMHVDHCSVLQSYDFLQPAKFRQVLCWNVLGYLPTTQDRYRALCNLHLLTKNWLVLALLTQEITPRSPGRGEHRPLKYWLKLIEAAALSIDPPAMAAWKKATGWDTMVLRRRIQATPDPRQRIILDDTE